MPNLTTSAILVITAVIVVCFVLALFSSGIIQPYLSGSTQSTLSVPAVNSIQSAIPVNTMFFYYSEYPTEAAVNYTEQWVFIAGNVSNVENQGGHYESCVSPSESYLYGCSYAAQSSGWVVWTWNNPTQAAKVPVDYDFTAECYVVGMNIGNLYLNSCYIVQS